MIEKHERRGFFHAHARSIRDRPERRRDLRRLLILPSRTSAGNATLAQGPSSNPHDKYGFARARKHEGKQALADSQRMR